MPASTVVNFRTVVHKTSVGFSIAFPDVCKTPCAPSPVPIPYPNIGMSSNTQKGTKKVKIDGNPIMVKGSNFSPTTGDEPGSLGGVVSNTFKGKSEFIMYSFDVKAEGKNVCRQLDMMMNNKQSTFNTPPTPELQPPNMVFVMDMPEEDPADLSALKTSDEGQEDPEK